MKMIKTCIQNINEKRLSRLKNFWSLHKFCRILIFGILMVMYISSFLIIDPDIVNAEEVYGKIRCNKCSSRILLIFKRGNRVIQKVRADNGQYSVYLSPGMYNVEIISNGNKWGVSVESLTKRNNQDINIQSK
jgi:DNA-directed RNA polymerase subunit RPC12/RpoP